MFKKLFIAIAVLGVGGLGIAYYYWTQATALPNWYQGQSSPSSNYREPAQSPQPSESPSTSTEQRDILRETKQKIQQQVQTTIQQQGTGQTQQEMYVTLNSQDFNQLVQSEISNQPKLRKLTSALPNIQTNIKKDNLEIGTVINPTKLETLDLPRQQKAMVNKIVTSFPQLKDQNIYIGIEGQPKLKNGQLTLARNSQVKIGKLTFTLPEVAQKLGVSPDHLQQSLNLNIDQLNLHNLQLKENEIILKVDSSDYVSQ